MHKVKIWLITAVVRLMALLPLRAAQAIGGMLGLLAWRLNGRSAKVTRRNIELCMPELSAMERDRLVRDSLIETGKCTAEMGKAWIIPPKKTLGYIKKVTDEFGLQEHFDQGNGVITLAPHLGNWEILNIYGANQFPLNVLYQPPKMIELDGFLRNARARMGSKIFPTDRRGVMALFKALRQGEMVAILPDQEPPKKSGVFAPFYGIEASTMTLLSKLIEKTDAKVVCGYAKRLAGGKGFEIVLKPADPEIYSTDLATSVAALNRSVEECIKDVPAQYQWEYKRFKTGPSGKTDYYRF